MKKENSFCIFGKFGHLKGPATKGAVDTAAVGT